MTEGTIDGYFPVEGIGAIDLLAKSNDGMEWLVIAVKGDNDRDKTVGKLLCHMGWVQKHLAEKGQAVQGMIVTDSSDQCFDYAIDVTQGISKLFVDLTSGTPRFVTESETRKAQLKERLDNLDTEEGREYIDNLLSSVETQ